MKTIASQAHLCPLPLTTRPRYWAYDYVMRLYPLPDIVSFYLFLLYRLTCCNFISSQKKESKGSEFDSPMRRSIVKIAIRYLSHLGFFVDVSKQGRQDPH